MDECIHGLEAGLCDQCYPKNVPVLEIVTAAGQRNARAKAATTRRVASAANKKVESVADQRVYHLTHVQNLAGILETGSLLADLSLETRPAVDISTSDTRESRRGTAVSGLGSATVSEFVPFFLVPNATIWEDIRSETPDARIASDARTASPADFVLLVTTLAQVTGQFSDDDAVVVTDGDAAHVLTRFAASTESSERMLRKLRGADDDAETILEAEFLVKGSVPVELITLIGVANDRARDEVKKILKGSDYSPKVAVYPPWFQRPDAD